MCVTGVDDTDPAHPIVTGTTTIEGVEVDLRMDFRPPFPSSQPAVLLAVPTALGSIPHVESTGEVCYLSGEGRILDGRHPGPLAVECLRRAKRVMSDGLTCANEGDYAEEYEAYWRRQSTEHVFSVVYPGDQACEIVAAEMGDRIILARSIADVEHYENHGLKSVTRHTGLFAPIADASPFTPVPDLADLVALRRAVWAGISREDAVVLTRLLRHRKKKSDYVLLQIPRPSGEPALVGLRFAGIDGAHPLCDGGTADTVQPLLVDRLDRDYLMPRGGAALALKDRKVCVVGCGAVGSRVVDHLVHAGISTLMLVDPDALAPENTYRHPLGRLYWGRNKAEALASWTMSNIPYLRVSHSSDDLATMLDKVPARDWADFDLVVFATGDQTAELAANSALKGSSRPPMLFTWLEPLGVGGHALLSLPNEAGCLQCLHTDPVGHLCESRMSFAAPGQTFSRDISGCGSRFTPFSDSHANTTAALAARLALDFLSGSLVHASADSWKGDSSDFVAAGFTLSDRYRTSSPERVTGFENSMCPVCGCGRLFNV